MVETVGDLLKLLLPLQISSLLLSDDEVSVVRVQLCAQLLALHDDALQKALALREVGFVAAAEVTPVHFLNDGSQVSIKLLLNRSVSVLARF